MIMKYNFGPLKGHHITFYIKGDICYHVINVEDLKKVKVVGENYVFYGSGQTFTIHHSTFDHMTFFEHKFLNSLVFSNLSSDKRTINPLVGFTMFDSYGFPIELTQEILEEEGYELDMEGYNLLRKLQRDMNKSTFKNKDCFQ